MHWKKKNDCYLISISWPCCSCCCYWFQRNVERSLVRIWILRHYSLCQCNECPVINSY
jgi:hypothetical protein